MKIIIRLPGGDVLPARLEDGGSAVVVASCPSCGADAARVRGLGVTHHDHDTYYAAARALCCGETIGTMETRVDTIFGIDEDERVLLRGRCRVY